MECPVCGKPNEEGARFCASCGAALPAKQGPGLIGQTLGGRYLVKSMIGEGGMGVVYAAEQRLGETVRRVAVKTLHPELSRDRVVVSRFFRECGTVAQLEHPNTVRIYDFGEASDGTLYIVMEFVAGRSLGDVIAEGPLPLERVTRILRQVCGALDEAHGLGIIHRDLKPDNIILSHRADESDFVKLLDFGIAKQVGKGGEGRTNLTQQGVVLGTPPYMSPEQLTGNPLDIRTDIYSLAIITYEMLTGRLPFEAANAFEWAKKHMTEQPRLPSTVSDRVIPPEAERAVMRALSKDPADRQGSAMQFYREIAGEPAPASSVRATSADVPSHRTSPMTSPPMSGPPLFPMQERTVGSPPFVPTFHTEAAVAAPIPPPPIARPRRGRGVFVALGILLVTAAIAFGFAFYFGAFDRLALGGSAATPPMPTVSVPESTQTTVINPEQQPGPIAPPPPAPIETPPPATVHTTKTSHPPATKAPPAPPPPAPAPPATTPAPTQTKPPAPPPPAPAPAPAPKQPPVTLPPPTPPSGPTGDVACSQSMSLAGSGQIESAVAMYHKCESGGSPAALNNARSRIRNEAPGAVRRRANLGDCAGAKSAADAATQIGAGDLARRELNRDCGG